MRTLIEAQEGFGAPPQNARLEAAMEALMSVNVWLSPERAAQLCMADADRVMRSAYDQVLPLVAGAGFSSASYDELKSLFHLAAELGEARMLMKLAEATHDRVGTPTEAA